VRVGKVGAGHPDHIRRALGDRPCRRLETDDPARDEDRSAVLDHPLRAGAERERISSGTLIGEIVR
jgi:hypothetical protein